MLNFFHWYVDVELDASKSADWSLLSDWTILMVSIQGKDKRVKGHLNLRVHIGRGQAVLYTQQIMFHCDMYITSQVACVGPRLLPAG